MGEQQTSKEDLLAEAKELLHKAWAVCVNESRGELAAQIEAWERSCKDSAQERAAPATTHRRESEVSEVLSGCAVRAAIQLRGDVFMKVQGVELENCRVCGQVPQVDKVPENGLRIGCENKQPEPHRCVIESEPGTFAIDTWNALNTVGESIAK